jgi:sorbose reductase
LWIDRQFEGGSIVVVSSMSSQIINVVDAGKPLTQVHSAVTLTRHHGLLTSRADLLQLVQGGGVEPGQGPRGGMGAAQDPCERALAGLRCAPHPFISGLPRESLCTAAVNTDQTSGMDKNVREFQAAGVPLKRFAEPEEMGGQTVLLLSEYGSYMTGGEYFVDG